MDRITVGEFAHILISECGEKPIAEEPPFAEEKPDAKRGNKLSEGVACRITDGYMIDDMLDRRAAAKITHLYIRDVLGIIDLDNINPAEILRDLYDCRVCVNHIAQIYLRGIMDAIKMESATGDPFYIFDGRKAVSEKEAEQIVDRVIGRLKGKEYGIRDFTSCKKLRQTQGFDGR